MDTNIRPLTRQEAIRRSAEMHALAGVMVCPKEFLADQSEWEYRYRRARFDMACAEEM